MKTIIAILLVFPSVAFAHQVPVAGSALAAGLAHPLGGLDHVIAMFAVGIWAAMLPGSARVVLPVSFVVAMILGAGLGAFGGPLPIVEHGILASLLVLGAFISLSLKLPLSLAAICVAVFGLFHGVAHGAESTSHSLFTYVLGFALSSSALHLLGLVVGRVLHGSALRVLGGGTLIGGLLLAIGG